MCIYAFGSIDDITRFFFFNDTATPEIYTLSLHDALPILRRRRRWARRRSRSDAHLPRAARRRTAGARPPTSPDRKSTRLNSSHVSISYAVFCLKKKTNTHEKISTINSSMPTYQDVSSLAH